MRAAVENGADAVYFGLQQFNARLRARNFDIADLPRIVAGLHERGVKAYITLNTLIFASELEEAAELIVGCSNAGVDAVLVQDLGFAALINRLAPELPIHASTQMTITSAESIAGVEALGLRIERIVAAREMSRKELARMRREIDRDVEVFVHGAICVAYSGQCLTSEALGGRSANRGECAQACRLPYDLVVDGETRDLGDVKYLLSPKDLAAYEDIGDLIRHGIMSLKIEGRYKSPEYVAATVQSYRAAVETAMHGEAPRMDAATRERLAMTFSRGLTGGYIHDIDHQAVVEGRFPKKRGLYLGRVLRVGRRGVVVALENRLHLGDGVVFDAGRPDMEEEGGRVYTMARGGSMIREATPPEGDTMEVELSFGEGALDFRNVRPGNLVWKTSDPRLDAELHASWAEEKIHHRRPVAMHLVARVGQPVRLSVTDWDGERIDAIDHAPAERATNRPLTREAAWGQLERLGNTPFALASLEVDLDPDVLVPYSRLNNLRRDAVEQLIARRRAIGTGRAVQAAALAEMRAEITAVSRAHPPVSESRLSVLCRSLEQVRAAVADGRVDTVYTDFEDIRLHKEARALVPADGGIRFVPATIRVVKPGESGFVRTLLNANPDAILVRNMASWHILREFGATVPCIADYSLNIANDLTAHLLYRHGFRELTPSYDLNIEQLLDMLRAAPAHWFEVTVHQYMPMFHMEHCVFCRFLSTGTDYTNCGRPCEDHDVGLRDRVGSVHPVKADAGCRNTVFNGVPQSASEYIRALTDVGVRRFRVDFLSETADEVRAAIDAYLPVIRGQADGQDLWRRLRATSKLGVTRGSLDHE